MSRARAIALALVNWKGVFYERYELDRHVTALEGANGAGKTTVMIAAYIVLLPDMSRLRFTNLGETAATGGDRGIWGRLGEPGRPAYAALEIDLGDGRRIIAGVLLQRKAEPTLELTPFLISDVPSALRLSQILLVTSEEHEAVPELVEVKAAVLAAGAKIQVFASAKDYFATLFELGVGALRLSSEEDRARLGDMLRTSMTGGISRAITSELRSFLLKEQGSLSDTLSRMRDNLAACRRTRIEVSEARVLEQEISGIYDAGQVMFAASLQARQQHAREKHEALAETERLLAAAEASREQLARELEALAGREAELVSRLAAERAAYAAVCDSARQANANAKIREMLAAIELELSTATARAEAQRSVQAASVSAREAAKLARSVAQQNDQLAALGLANLQAGLDELHRRSSAWRNADRALSKARALLRNPELRAEDVARELDQHRARLSAIDAERLACVRDLELAERRRNEWHVALSALVELGHTCEPELAFQTAREELQRLGELEKNLARRGELENELAECRRLSQRQKRAEAALLELGLELTRGSMLERIQESLSLLETEAAELEATQRGFEREAHGSDSRRAALSAQIGAAEARVGRYQKALELAKRLSQNGEAWRGERDDLLRHRDQLGEERRELLARIEQCSRSREQLLGEANQVEASGGQFPIELLRLKDELEGELLASRFEDLEPARAQRLEALLGPLAQAIVVDDLERATEQLSQKPRELRELRLIAAGTELGFLDEPEARASHPTDVCVPEGPALRITRIPEQPTLGRKARENRLVQLRKQALEAGTAAEAAQTKLRGIERALADVDALLPELELLQLGDPSLLLAELRTEAQSLEETAQAHAAEILRITARANELALRIGRFRKQLPETFLLDAAPYAERAAEIAEALSESALSQARLERARAPRALLSGHLDALRSPPLDEAALERLQAENAARTSERDRLFECIEALVELEANLVALEWQDAEDAIRNQAEVLPALEQQHQGARKALEAAEQALHEAETSWEKATEELQAAEAGLSAIRAHYERLALEAGSSATESKLSAAELESQAAEFPALIQRLEREEREVLAERGRNGERLHQAETDAERHRRELSRARSAAEPAAARFRALVTRAEAAHVLHSGQMTDALASLSSVALLAEARSKRDLLRDRLARARGGEELARELSQIALDDDEVAFLELWLEVRAWLSRRVPAQIAEVDEPLEALERLRDRLSALEQRLAHQEADLRGASEDVARGIEVQLRRAKSQVRRLNQNLSQVGFGSIAGIRVELRRVAQMEPVLRALAEGAAQELLFQSNLPMEEALGEILRRFGGGRGGGARVLDYREYIELFVEVQRKADAAWEPANPTRLSTGEAIGVGAALMMVVLAEWERDANLLRSRRGPGSLRFLFLDEANRLSQDNLGALFDLCEALDLQLLIAAPEVARCENNTTYRLVRKVTEDGREEVLVSGRRKLQTEVEAEPTRAPEAALAQVSLFD